VTPAQARELAGSFRLDRCDVRTGLVDLLTAHSKE
jgi:hypothetical protein